ncbi:hypothetical protein FRC16_004538 [Serendipita sp. 398]|nr:hypothetical protein FRC16_004538 [Serendipita sp. 398]
MVNSLFAYMGTELIGVTVGEAENPRKNIPKAIKRTFFRILVFYIGGVFVIGLIVPSTANDLFIATTQATTGAAASPFVVAATMLGIRGLRHVINGQVLMTFGEDDTDSSDQSNPNLSNSDLYIGSRTLYGLALEGKAPKIFRRVNRMGVPWPALLFCTAFCPNNESLTSSKGSSRVFKYFVNLVSTFGAITWMCILYTHIRFMKALKVQGISRDTLPYKAPFQPYGAYFAIVGTAIITFFKGFDAFLPFKADGFVTAYIGISAFVFFLSFWKIRFREHTIPLAEVDLISGKKQIDDEEERYLAEQEARGPRTRWQKLWDAL